MTSVTFPSGTSDDQVRFDRERLTTDLHDEYDYIVCGSGSSGSVVARRLAEDPNCQVLLLEAGGDDLNASVTDPGRWFMNLGTERVWSFVAEPNAALHGRRMPLEMGKGLGGGSSVNAMIWSRGHQDDWDFFSQEAGDDAWSYASVLDIYRSIEDWHGAPDPQRRGRGGLIHVESPIDPNPLAPAVLRGAAECGLPVFEDQNGVMMEGKGGAALTNLRIRDGKRQSIFRTYVYPLMGQPNLTVRTQALVCRVLLERAAATGVEVLVDGKTARVRARREVILSLGAIHTPKVLMQTGIGDAEHLRANGIACVQHLPGVGQNLQDHLFVAGCIWEYNHPLPPRNNAGEATMFWNSDAGPTSVRSYALPQGLISGQITSVLPLRSGPVLIGCIGGLDEVNDGKITHLISGRKLGGSQVTAMFEDSRGRIWIGVDQGLYFYANGQLRAVPFREQDPRSVVRRITEEANGAIWVLTSSAGTGILKYDAGFLVPDPLLKQVHATDIVGNSAGLWFAEDSRVRLYADGKVDNDIPVISANDLADNRRGGVWIVTLDSLSLWTRAGIVSLVRGRELPPDKLISAAVDRDGNLWVSTTDGLLQFSKNTVDQLFSGDKRHIAYRIFGSSDGFQPDRCPFRPRVLPALDGKIWFPQETRAQSIDPRALVVNDLPPPVYVTELVADNRRYQLASTVSLPAHTRDLHFEYTALSFAVPAAVRFRYLLEGWDHSWQEAGNRRGASYTNLPPGKYRFQLRASNNDGVWNLAGTSVAIILPPAFYQTGWFTVSLCTFLLLLSWLLFRLRLRTATNKVTRELTTRLRERERIARELHDTLLQGFQGLVLRFQLVLDQLPPGEAVRKELESALQLSDEVMVEGRRRVMNLRDGSEEGDLVQSLRDAEPFVRGTSSAAHDLRVLGEARALQPIVHGEIFAIWKEAASNAFQHSRAVRVSTEIAYTSSAFSLSVEDNGVGIEPQILQYGKRNHWGLQGMRERAQDIGAKLTVQSDAVRGTRIHLRVDSTLCYVSDQNTLFWQRFTGLFARWGRR